MAMSVGRSRGGPIADINVTPMADVMIVLLIIFMVATPIIARPVELPRASHLTQHKGEKLEIVLRRRRRSRDRRAVAAQHRAPGGYLAREPPSRVASGAGPGRPRRVLRRGRARARRLQAGARRRGSAGGRAQAGRGARAMKADINVTPRHPRAARAVDHFHGGGTRRAAVARRLIARESGDDT